MQVNERNPNGASNSQFEEVPKHLRNSHSFTACSTTERLEPGSKQQTGICMKAGELQERKWRKNYSISQLCVTVIGINLIHARIIIQQ